MEKKSLFQPVWVFDYDLQKDREYGMKSVDINFLMMFQLASMMTNHDPKATRQLLTQAFAETTERTQYPRPKTRTGNAQRLDRTPVVIRRR